MGREPARAAPGDLAIAPERALFARARARQALRQALRVSTTLCARMQRAHLQEPSVGGDSAAPPGDEVRIPSDREANPLPADPAAEAPRSHEVDAPLATESLRCRCCGGLSGTWHGAERVHGRTLMEMG